MFDVVDKVLEFEKVLGFGLSGLSGDRDPDCGLLVESSWTKHGLGIPFLGLWRLMRI